MSWLDSLGEFGEMAGDLGNDLLVKWQEKNENEKSKPKESGISARSPEKAVNQQVEVANTQQADSHRAIAANMGGELKKYLPYAGVALLAVLVLRAKVF